MEISNKIVGATAKLYKSLELNDTDGDNLIIKGQNEGYRTELDTDRNGQISISEVWNGFLQLPDNKLVSNAVKDLANDKNTWISQLDSPDQPVRYSALKAIKTLLTIKQFGDGQKILDKVLDMMMNDPDISVRTNAVEVLALIGKPPAKIIDALKAIWMENTQPPILRATAAKVLFNTFKAISSTEYARTQFETASQEFNRPVISTITPDTITNSVETPAPITLPTGPGFASETLKGDREIVLGAIRKNGSSAPEVATQAITATNSAGVKYGITRTTRNDAPCVEVVRTDPDGTVTTYTIGKDSATRDTSNTAGPAVSNRWESATSSVSGDQSQVAAARQAFESMGIGGGQDFEARPETEALQIKADAFQDAVALLQILKDSGAPQKLFQQAVKIVGELKAYAQ